MQHPPSKQKMLASTLVLKLRDLLHRGSVKTQEDIKQALEQLGFEVNQSKISRLLRKIGAVKVENDAGEIVYRLPREPVAPSTQSSLAQLVVSISYNEMTIVIHTSPGSASLLARVLDHEDDRLEILGTIAGDDTILIIPKSIARTKIVCEQVKLLLANV